MKKTIDDIGVRGRRVLVRLDLNVPLDDSQTITNDQRIRAALPTVKRLLAGGGRLILMSHLGRPGKGPDDWIKFSLAPVAARLSELLDARVRIVSDCVGGAAHSAAEELADGELCLLENLRFHREETIKDRKAADDPSLRERKDRFAADLAGLAEVYVCDAFGTCHRDNASMLTVPRMMAGKPRVMGYLVQREFEILGGALTNPARPFVCLLGGAKVSDKLGVVQSLLARCDTILVGGAMAYTFLAADGMETGRSLVEPDLFDTARNVRAEAGDRLRLPIDSITAKEIKEGSETMVHTDAIPSERMGLDIGPKTIDAYKAVIDRAGTIFWNGPMGVFEVPPFNAGTLAMAAAVADATDRGAVSIIGGGDSAAAIDQAGLADRITHVSTGGGASLELMEGKQFPAIDVLDDA